MISCDKEGNKYNSLVAGKALYCKKCHSFLVKANEDNWLEFPKNVKISSNGEYFKIKCKCGEETLLKIK
ncbi:MULTISPECIES: hypothetical protein [unclassified Fusobacterium]|uniref:hypothetical protein n=1 Tax=unclassified Fusobacterium TaxID=2648384 RepID=UPI001B8C06A3|nr:MULTISPECIES: hypothetical protein [unclassified Fusobacterium]